jgi:hypothetical protein
MSELSNNLSTAEMQTAEWRAKVGRITGASASAKAVVDSSERRRAEHALAAALGDPSASAATKRIHADDENAKRQLDDLTLALIPAKQALAAAEQAEGAARKALNKALAEQLMNTRIALAARIDKALADFDTLVGEYDSVGEDLRGYYLEMFGQNVSISALENAFGPTRLISALSPAFSKMFPNVIRPERRVALEVSERDYWQLPDAPTIAVA